MSEVDGLGAIFEYGSRGSAWGWIEIRVVKRATKCKKCGARLRKGDLSVVYEYQDGPYIRRRRYCVECGRAVFLNLLRFRVEWARDVHCDRFFWDHAYSDVSVSEGMALHSLGYRIDKEKFCKDRMKEFPVYLDERIRKLSEFFGVDTEHEVKKIDRRARVVWGSPLR